MAARYSATYRSEPQNVATARNAVANFARSCGFGTDEVFEIEIAVGEALANAVEHGVDRHGGTFIVRCEGTAEGSIVIEVSDSGRGFQQTAPVRNDSESGLPSRGFGMTLMRSMMNELTYSRNGSVVRMVRYRQASERGGKGHLH